MIYVHLLYNLFFLVFSYISVLVKSGCRHPIYPFLLAAARTCTPTGIPRGRMFLTLLASTDIHAVVSGPHHLDMVNILV